MASPDGIEPPTVRSPWREPALPAELREHLEEAVRFELTASFRQLQLSKLVQSANSATLPLVDPPGIEPGAVAIRFPVGHLRRLALTGF